MDLYLQARPGPLYRQETLIDALSYSQKSTQAEEIRIHDLRHTFALKSLQAGADFKTLQNDLGHESIQTA